MKAQNETSNREFNTAYSFSDIARISLKNKVLILAIAFIVLLIGVYASYTAEPVYRASVNLRIEDKSAAENIFGLDDSESNGRISEEIEIIKSRKIAMGVIEELWDSEWRMKLHLFENKRYVPRGQWLRSAVKRIITLGIWQDKGSVENDINYTIPIEQLLVKRFSNKIMGQTTVQSRSGTNIVIITVSSPFPDDAKIIANAYAKVYKALDYEWMISEALGLTQFLESEINPKYNEMIASGERLIEFKEINKVFSPDQEASNKLNQISESKVERNILEGSIKADELILSETESAKENINYNTDILEEISVKKENIRALEKEIEIFKRTSSYKDSKDDIENIQMKIDDLHNQIETFNLTCEQDIEACSDPYTYSKKLQSQIDDLDKSIKRSRINLQKVNERVAVLESELGTIPSLQKTLEQLQTEFDVKYATYQRLIQKLEEAKISLNSIQSKVRIVDEASRPVAPVSPNIRVNILLSIVIGFGLGILSAFVREFFDNSIKSIEYLEGIGLSILAIIPVIGDVKSEGNKNNRKKKKQELRKKKADVGTLQRRLITHEDPKSPVSEAYRGLRTSLIYSTHDKGKKTIMISSPGPGEGKTTTIINLAITYANLGKKTLIIDADLRKPVLHKVFNQKKDKGLTHLIAGNGSDDYSTVVKSTEVDNLDLITCGVVPPNPSELLASDELEKLIVELEKKYDIILFDAPPIMAVTDAIVLSRLINQFVLVVHFAKTDKGAIARTLNQMAQVNVEQSGVVLNALDYRSSYYYSGSYYNYYNYYYYGSEK